jgi:hypothetical protein
MMLDTRCELFGDLWSEAASRFFALIPRAILVRVTRSSTPLQVDIGILHEIFVGPPGADLQDECIAIGPVLNMVTVRNAGFEPSAITCTQHLFAGIRDEHDLTLQHPHELILRSVPVALAGPSPRRKTLKIDPELG